MGVKHAIGVVLLGASCAQASLVGLYTFEGNNSDSSGNGYDPVSGTVTYSQDGFGYEGKAAVFDGASSYLQLGIDVSPSAMPGMTFGAWVQCDDFTRVAAVLSCDDAADPDYDRQIGIDTRYGTEGSYGSAYYSAFAGGDVGLVSSQEDPSGWTFIAASYDADAETMSLYVGDNKYTSEYIVTDTENNSLNIGRNPAYGDHWDGMIDNAFVFDSVLTDENISTIRDNGEDGILSVAAVPEPAVISLLGSCCLGILMVRRFFT